jgi:hypothetical protein
VETRRQRPPLRWAGILFAFAATLLLVTLAGVLVERSAVTGAAAWPLPIGAAAFAGLLTTLYVRSRSAMHALLGSVIAMPIATAFTFQGIWQLGVYMVAAATIGAGLLEILLILTGWPARPTR